MKNYYSKLVGKIKNRILPSKESVLGIDVGAGYLKVVELSLVEENTIKAVAINSLDKSIFDEEGIADINLLSQILRRTIEVNGISAKHAVLSLGGRALFAREILFPKMTETELTEAIKWEIEKYVPYEPEKYFYDYNVIGEAENGKEITIQHIPEGLRHIQHRPASGDDIGNTAIDAHCAQSRYEGLQLQPGNQEAIENAQQKSQHNACQSGCDRIHSHLGQKLADEDHHNGQNRAHG